jgi:hypothetical protein
MKATPSKNTLIHTLFNLPPHLMKTYLATLIIDQTTSANEVSKLTRKARAQESSYLNQLALMGYLSRTKNKRTVLFTVKRLKSPQTKDDKHIPDAYY